MTRVRTGTVFVAIALLTLDALTVAGQTPAADHSYSTADWLKIVPGEAHFYAELRDLAGVRSLFRNLGIWDTVRELSEAPPRGATTQPWHRKAEELLGMDAEAAIDQILGRRTALIASEPQDWQNGVLLAELDKVDDLKPLLKRWKAKKQADEGTIDRYTLAGGLMLAVVDRTIALGPAGDPEGLWGRTVLLMSGRRGPNLAGRSEFASLRARLSANYPGMLYVTWPDGNPTAIAGCSRLLVGFSVTGKQIACELQGQRTSPVAADLPCDTRQIGALPATSLAVLSDTFDFASIGKEAAAGKFSEGSSLVSFAIGAFSSPDGTPSDLIARLGPPFTIVVGPDKGAKQGSPELPSVAVLLPVKDGEQHIRQLDILFGFLGQLLAVTSVHEGEEPRDVPVITRQIGDVPVHRVELGSSLAKRTGFPVLQRLELCWCLFDGRLVICTSSAQLEDIIGSSQGRAPRIDGTGLTRESAPTGDDAGGSVGQWVYLRGGAIAGVLTSWLTHLAKDHPEMLQESWWRQWAAKRIERYTRLGVALEADPTSPVRAVVREVDNDSPAKEYLQAGDIILGAAGRALTTTRPALEVAQRYRERGSSRRFELRIQRAGEIRDIRIPVQPADPSELQDFDPIDALRHLVTLTRHVDTLTVQRFTGKPDRLTARITIRWDESK